MKNVSKYILKVAKILVAVVVSIMIGYNLYLINAQVFLHEKLPMPFGYGTAVVASNSMYPYLEINDLIIIQKTNDYEVGDIIVYDDGDVLVVHRLVEIDDQLFIAKGDANDSNDRAYSVSLIKGEVIDIKPKIGVLQEKFNHPMVKIGGIIICVILFELSFRLDKKKKLEDKKDEEDIQAEIKRLKEELEQSKE